MNEYVRTVTDIIFSETAKLLGISIPKKQTDKETENICSLALCLSAEGKPERVIERGINSIFDRIGLFEGEKPNNHKFYYDTASEMFSHTPPKNKTDDLLRLESALLSQSFEQRLSAIKKYASDIPCSKNGELSVYDLSRLSLAFASSLAVFFKQTEMNTDNDLSAEKAFVLYTADFSGIQNFIYTVTQDHAIKRLRAKSFFVELFMSYLCSEITDMFGVTSANVLYSGGGHCYILLPNTKDHRSLLSALHKKLDMWSIRYFGNNLSVVWETQECSVNDFSDKPRGAYESLFGTLSQKLSLKKLCRYSASDITEMNRLAEASDKKRECRICGSSSVTVSDGKDECPWCVMFSDMSKAILEDNMCFAVLEKPKGNCVPFFSVNGQAYFCICDRNGLADEVKNNSLRRVFIKNGGIPEYLRGRGLVSNLDVCNYSSADMLEEHAENSEGIKRIGVLRMDVDNLGSAFISGFAVRDKNGKIIDSSYVNISRTASLSAMLSGFFKNNLTQLLESKKYDVSVIYAGGDDVFLVGSWDSVIGSAQDIIKAFREYTSGRLTISGGIGIYDHKYPASKFASETEILEACSKNNKNHNKDSVTLFSPQNRTFSWDEFSEKVMDEKLGIVTKLIKEDSDKGNSFLYKLLEYLCGITEHGDKINIARAAYILGRMVSDADNDDKANVSALSERIFGFITSGKTEDIRQLITAITIFVYKERRSQKNE